MGSKISNNKKSKPKSIKDNNKEESFNSKNNNSEINNGKKSILENIKSKFILKKILNYIQRFKIFKIIKCSKSIQNSLNMNINSYKEFSETLTPIEIEIIPVEKFYEKCKFINIEEDDEMIYYHIFFNDSKEEVKRNYYTNNDEKVEKIKIIIEHEIKSFSKLFEDCRCIKSISFKKFYRTNIIDMSYMFHGCLLLQEINFAKFNTINVTYMNSMFSGCS